MRSEKGGDKGASLQICFAVVSLSSTPLVLDVLRHFNVKATFFIIKGNCQGREHIVQRMVAEGHELGNHGTEDEPMWRLYVEPIGGLFFIY